MQTWTKLTKKTHKNPNSVIVSAFADTTLEEDLSNFLNKYGHITKTTKTDHPQSPQHNNTIVEYENRAALSALEPSLPVTLQRQKMKPAKSEYFQQSIWKLSPIPKPTFSSSYCWLSTLSSFEFQLQYRTGKQNVHADGLSCPPHPEPVNDLVSLKEQEQICQFVKHNLPGTDIFCSSL